MTTPTSKRTTSPAFQFYPSDFLGSTKVQLMSAAEVGAYVLLLCACWQDGGIPRDSRRLAVLARMKPKQFDRAWEDLLSECFVVKGDRYVNARLEVERKKQADYRRQQKERADKGWQSRKTATALPEARHQSGNALQSSSSSPSSSSSSEERQTARSAPIGRRRNLHAAFEGARGLYVLQGQHQKFLDFLNGRVSETELVLWYETTAEAWATGPFSAQNVDPNQPRFWDARFAERWPPDNPRRDKWAESLPPWARKARAAVRRNTFYIH